MVSPETVAGLVAFTVVVVVVAERRSESVADANDQSAAAGGPLYILPNSSKLFDVSRKPAGPLLKC